MIVLYKPVRVYSFVQNQRPREGVLVDHQSRRGGRIGILALVCEFSTHDTFAVSFDVCQPINPLGVTGGVVGMLACPVAVPEQFGQFIVVSERSGSRGLSLELHPVPGLPNPPPPGWFGIDQVLLLGAANPTVLVSA